MTDQLQIKAKIGILKPASEVFDAIVDPAKMSNYFISKASGRMEAGKTINWQFPEMDMSFSIKVHQVEKDKFISYSWNDFDGTETKVDITITSKTDNHSFVSITESYRKNDDEGINWLRRNTEGWANFLACLKAWIEHGINLRKGAFDMSDMPEVKTT
jgi:uncharacterized protein YndB with AHSA1/START domain